MNPKKITELDAILANEISDDDVLPVVDVASGETKKMSLSQMIDDVQADWGDIGGTLSNQTDLQNALNAKSNTGHNHTASDITDFDIEVANNTDVAANTAARHDAVTVTDSAEIDFTLTGQDITASLKAGSIDETKLDASTNASLDLADSALQNVVEDTTPQLGGDLDVNGNNITSAAGLNVAIGASAGNDFTVDTDKLVVEGDTGNVGIGTTSPGAKLHITDDSSDVNLHVQDSQNARLWNIGGTGIDNYAQLIFGEGVTGGEYGGMFRYTNATTGGSGGVLNVFSRGTPLAFSTQNLFADNFDMYIDTSGNVGIGLTDPGEALSVAGNVMIGDSAWSDGTTTGDLAIQGNVGIGTSNPNGLLHVSGGVTRMSPAGQNSSLFHGDNASFVGTDHNITHSLVLWINGNSSAWGNNTTKDFHLVTDKKERITIAGGGNVGIGTTTPDTKLHVTGAVTQEPLSADPADPDAGNSVQWVSDGTGSGSAGDVMMKINVGGTVKTVTLVDYSAL